MGARVDREPMSKCCAGPGDRRMASGASLGKSRGNMVGVGDRSKFAAVA